MIDVSVFIDCVCQSNTWYHLKPLQSSPAAYLSMCSGSDQTMLIGSETGCFHNCRQMMVPSRFVCMEEWFNRDWFNHLAS